MRFEMSLVRLVFCVTIIVLTALTGSGQTREEENQKRDPFKLPYRKTAVRPAGIVLQGDRWRLTGILVGNSDGRIAILNEQIVSEGDSVAGGTVKAIESDHIVLTGVFGKRTLRINSDLGSQP
ncbi:MAG TPA: hypothetical protein VN944_03535 [Nitrospiria bacterium]|nr:hypothetical protein [Nitrospiria bacterium]